MKYQILSFYKTDPIAEFETSKTLRVDPNLSIGSIYEYNGIVVLMVRTHKVKIKNDGDFTEISNNE